MFLLLGDYERWRHSPGYCFRKYYDRAAGSEFHQPESHTCGEWANAARGSNPRHFDSLPDV